MQEGGKGTLLNLAVDRQFGRFLALTSRCSGPGPPRRFPVESMRMLGGPVR